MKQTMYDNWSYGLKMAFSMVIVLMALTMKSSAEETPIPSQNAPAAVGQHVMAKRAWSQLQGSWGKRNAEDNSLEEFQRKLIKMYAEQLLANKVDETVEEYDDEPMEKRAWNSMNSAWGKRDWNQLRANGWGKREAAWNNMKGLWGKRSPGWNKLQSAWGK